MTTVMTTSVGVQGEYLQHGASIAIERPYDLDDFVSSTNFEFVADILQQDTPTDIRAHWAVIKLAFTMVERERQHRMRLEERVAILERQVEKLSVPEPASAPLRPDLEPASNHVDDDLRGDMDTVLDVSRLLKVAKPEVDTTTPQVPEHESDPEAEQLDASFSGCVIPQIEVIVDDAYDELKDEKASPAASVAAGGLGRHSIEKVSGPRDRTRRRCCGCYKELAKQIGTARARIQAKKVITRCTQCMKFYCLTCFALRHMVCSAQQ